MSKRKNRVPAPTQREVPLPSDVAPYAETGAEKLAQCLSADQESRILQLMRRAYSDGMVKYCVPGLEPDTEDTLVAAGLIRCKHGKHDRTEILVLFPDNPRVLAWQIGLNESCRSHGLPEIFPGVAAPFAPSSAMIS